MSKKDLYDHCKEGSGVTRSEALEFVSKEEWEEISKNLIGITLSMAHARDGEPIIPARDILYALTNDTVYFD